MTADRRDGASPSIRIGCSGWNYRHRRGVLYPDELRARDWFAYFAARFDTVEINNSFYRLPKAETFDSWRRNATAAAACAALSCCREARRGS